MNAKVMSESERQLITITTMVYIFEFVDVDD